MNNIILIILLGLMFSCNNSPEIESKGIEILINNVKYKSNNIETYDIDTPFSKKAGKEIIYRKLKNMDNLNFEYYIKVYLNLEKQIELVVISQINLQSKELKFFYSSKNLEESLNDNKINLILLGNNYIKLDINGLFFNIQNFDDKVDIKGIAEFTI